MDCNKVLDTIYEYSGGGPIPPLQHIRIALHLFFCPDCAQEVERLEATLEILHSDFLPPSPGFEDPIMALIARGEEEFSEAGEWLETPENPGGLSTRAWVIAGLCVLISLSTAFVGLDFNKIAHIAGMSFLLPVGITIGIVLTSYGALFIGSHLKELSERFGL
jgi:hypothetical protein